MLFASLITWFIPFIGHMGIAYSNGVIRDFAGPYFAVRLCLSEIWWASSKKVHKIVVFPQNLVKNNKILTNFTKNSNISQLLTKCGPQLREFRAKHNRSG